MSRIISFLFTYTPLRYYVQSFWRDEAFSYLLAKQDIVSLLLTTARDANPPLYYLLLHFWMALNGDSSYYVRFLSVLFSVATIPFIYLIGKRISGPATGLAAAVLLTVSPFNIRYSQETRMYTLLVFNAAVALYALVRLLTDGRAARPIGSQLLEYLRAWRRPDTLPSAR